MSTKASQMNIVIFAGGTGTRLWPLSRRSTPKQFGKIIGNDSTVQLAVKRLLPDFGYQDIYISTGVRYVGIVKEQLPDIPHDHIIGEPEIRDVGPAVGLMAAILAKDAPKTPMAILWSDHLVRKEELFRKILSSAKKIIDENSQHIVFIGQKPRFASQNLGWIEYGGVKTTLDTITIRAFKGFKYRPNLDEAQRFFKDGHHAWNLGYFVTTPEFLLSLYKSFVPTLYKKLITLQKTWGTSHFKQDLEKIYPTIESVHFDNAILERLDPKDASVMTENLEWSDVGAWEALKEALQENPEQNVTQGRVLLTDCQDSLVYNYTDQLVVTIDLDGVFVVNTDDVLLVCRKDSVPKIKTLVNSFSGTKNERLS